MFGLAIALLERMRSGNGTREDFDGAKILVVDDEHDLAETTAELLATRGHHVAVAHDGVDALERMRQPPDLVVLDVEMPRMTGIEVLEHMRSSAKLRSVPVVLVTAVASLIAKSVDTLWDALVGKPYVSAELLRIVDELLSARRSATV